MSHLYKPETRYSSEHCATLSQAEIAAHEAIYASIMQLRIKIACSLPKAAQPETNKLLLVSMMTALYRTANQCGFTTADIVDYVNKTGHEVDGFVWPQ